jgi:glutathione S-transferase
MRVLYHSLLSPSARKVRVVLAEKNLDFTMKAEKVWERRPEFLALNPAGEVPVLIEPDSTVLAGTDAIVEYLDEVYREKMLIGINPGDRAEVRRLVAWFDGKMQREVTENLVGEKMMKRMIGEGQPNSQAIRAGHANLPHHLDYIGYLVDRRRWLAGDHFSVADITAAAHLSTLDYLGDIPWDQHELAREWYARIKSRPSFRAILADHVPRHRAAETLRRPRFLNLSLGKSDGYRVLAVFVVLLAIVSVPLFSTVLPPLVDYPNHLARLHLIAEGGNWFYAVRWAPLPDLAADLIVPVLARAMPLAMAGKLFLVLTFALIAGGTVWLNRVATGCWRLWPLLTFLLLYDRILLWGFINYLFGLGVAICGVALWLALEQRGWPRLATSMPVALACFFSHIAAFGVYGLAIVGVELPQTLSLLRARRYGETARRIAGAAAQFVIPAVILFGFQPASTGAPISYEFWRKADLLFSVFDNYSRPFDIACFVLFLGLIGGLPGGGG